MMSFTRIIQIFFLTLLMSPALVRAEIIATIHEGSAAQKVMPELDLQETREKMQVIKKQLNKLEKREPRKKDIISSVTIEELIGHLDFVEYTEKLKTLRFDLAFRD
ncbi:hypothetical protein [Endozoicomonas numazuensis]|uniref:Uncharacterized protein n=1 Tax=Endozoicomonas numazuensis TaxID=1137799 RepID=A0A081NMJ7_9GAMM|nr:hypothetical protein [Endozoicomonas numazuensis]KEQ19670.1 hypothetical protein GZ78_07245 [Endozoicomonas numazuensis]